jgi:hypothetical protein
VSKILIVDWTTPYHGPDVRELLEILQQLDLGYDVEFAPREEHKLRPQDALGPPPLAYEPWLEFLRVSVPWDSIASAVAGAAVTKIVDAAVEWARDGRVETDDGPGRPPTHISIYGPNGEVLKCLVVTTLHGKPRDRTNEVRARIRANRELAAYLERKSRKKIAHTRSGTRASGAMAWARRKLLLLLGWMGKSS